jgi:hypothetical protein
MIVHRVGLAIAIGETFVAFGNRGLSVEVALGAVVAARKCAAHERAERRAARDFAAVFEFVAVADGGFHYFDLPLVKAVDCGLRSQCLPATNLSVLTSGCVF